MQTYFVRGATIRGSAVGLALALAACSGDDGSRDDAGGSATVGTSVTMTDATASAASASESAGESATDGGSDSESAGTSTSTTGASVGTTDASESDSDGTTTTTTGVTASDSDSESDSDSTSTGEPVDECEDELAEIDAKEPYIWISNTLGGTVTKINTETALIGGRYRTNSATAYQPSRTTVNDLGDMLVAHRESPGGVTKIAGHASRCVDINNNGTIDTSTGFDDVRAWGEDECMIWHQETPGGAGPRAVAWEPSPFNKDTCEFDNPNPRVWVAYRPAAGIGRVLRLDGATGAILDTVDTDIGGGLPYGGAVDVEGDFWYTARSGPFLFHIDSETLAVERFTTPNNPYGVAIDSYGNPFIADYHQGAGVDAITRFNVETQAFEQIIGVAGRHRGIQIDTKGIAWAAGNSPCRLVKADTENNVILDDAIALPGCQDPVGVSIDQEGDVWVVDRGSSIALELDPETHEVKNTVTGLIGSYTYSDMTGNSLGLVQGPKPG